MEYQKLGAHIAVRLDPGDEIVASLKKIAEAESLQVAFVNGIGATNHIELGYYEIGAKKYHSTVHEGDMEILNLAGNINRMDGEPYLHLHTTVAHANGTVYGGHMNKGIISATAEIFLTCIDEPLGRRHDDEIGLNLLDFEKKA